MCKGHVGLTGGVAGGVTELTPSAPMGTLRLPELVLLPVVLVVLVVVGIMMYGACTACIHERDAAH